VIEITTHTRHFAVVKIDDRRKRRIDLYAATSTASLDSTEHEHAVAEIAKLVTEHIEFLPGVADHLEVPFDALTPSVAVALDRPVQRREECEVRRRKVGEGVYLTQVQRVYSLPGDLHMFL